MRKNQIICRVTWLSPLPGGRSTTPNYSLKARMLRIKQTNGLDFSTALPTSPRRLPILPQPVFHEVPRAARPWTTGSKNISRSYRTSRWKWSTFYSIAEPLECLDHSGSTGALRLGTYRRAAFLIADPLMQNHPEQSAESMGNGPDGLLVSQTRLQFAKCDFKSAAFNFNR